MDSLPQSKTDVMLTGYNGDPVPMRTLYYDHASDREVHLVVSSDNMRVYLKLLPGADFSGLTREYVAMVMADAGIVAEHVDPGISLFINMQNSNTPFPGFFQVAHGVAMRKGEKGSIEFHVQPTSLVPRYDESEFGTIDFKQLNLIENCFSGQRVATVLPPGPGRIGRDVFGDPISPVAGEAVVVQAGSGIIMSANGRDFTSDIEGRLVFENNVLSISPTLEIPCDIDYSVGNIDFVGKVIVNGSLLDGFYIDAKRGVELYGDVGAGRISSEGDVKITGGIKGKNAAIITCRSLTVHYIDDAMVEAYGHVVVNKEIMNSSVKALGRVTVTDGAIIGGEVCGLQGVEAGTLGSDMGVTTQVMAGLDWTEENRKDEIRVQVAEYMDRLHSAKTLLEPLFLDKEVIARLGSEQKTMLADLIAELREIRERLAELLEERTRIDMQQPNGVVAQINVKKMLYMGVNTRFPAGDGQIKDSVKGPMTLTPGSGREALRTGAYTKLPPLNAAPEDGSGEAMPTGTL